MIMIVLLGFDVISEGGNCTLLQLVLQSVKQGPRHRFFSPLHAQLVQCQNRQLCPHSEPLWGTNHRDRLLSAAAPRAGQTCGWEQAAPPKTSVQLGHSQFVLE